MSYCDQRPYQTDRLPPEWAGSPSGLFSISTAPGDLPIGNGYLIDDESSRSPLVKTTHWSIAWSDLMMTMFVLFLSLFVYQAAHKEFLVSDEIAVIGGDTAAAQEISAASRATFPFVPISPGAPLVTAGTVKKIEPIRLEDIDPAIVFFDEPRNGGRQRLSESLNQDQPAAAAQDRSQTKQASRVSTVSPAREYSVNRQQGGGQSEPGQPIVEAIRIDQALLERLDLEQFAAIDLIPDQTMRIILTGDLLFATGQAELTKPAIASLKTIAAIINATPYLINVVGHTDDIPIHSERFASNWELSVARASRVARFLIDDMAMDPNQFVVSGYGAQRPREPNTDPISRAANRRVEIIISKKLPAPTIASLQSVSATRAIP